MSFDLTGKINIKDNGAMKTFNNLEKQMDQVRKATDNYRDATGKLRNSQGKFITDTDKMNRKLRESKSLFGDMKGAFAGGMGFGVGNTVINGIGNAASAAAGLIGDSVKKAMDFEAQMLSLQALTGATDKQRKSMQELALAEGMRTKYSSLEAAQAIEELLKAGMNEATVQAGGLKASLNLATAGGLELQEAAEVMSTSMNAFRKDGLSAARTSDILAGTALVAATDVHALGLALAEGGAVADMVGTSFKDFNTAIGMMSNDGLKSGSSAGTSYKSMLMYLQPQTKKATALFNKLGIGVDTTNKFFENGKIKPLEEVAQLLQDITKGMTDQKRTDTFLELFSTDGVKAASTLYKAGAKGVKEFQRQMANVSALDIAKKKMEGAGGAVEQLKGALETLQISALLPTMPLITRFADGVGKLIRDYSPQITAAMEQMAKNASNYLNKHFTNNPAFKKLPDLQSKIKFVFDDVMNSFNEWLAGGGTAAIQSVATKTVDILAGALKASKPLIDATVTMGVAMGKGLLQGILSDPTLAMFLGGGAGLKLLNKYGKATAAASTASTAAAAAAAGGTIASVTGPAALAGGVFAAATGYSASVWENVKKDPNSIYSTKLNGGVGTGSKASTQSITAAEADGLANYFKGGIGKSGGIDNVPFNGMQARLHSGEAVLTRSENKDYRENGGSKGVGVNITIHATIREEADIDRLAGTLARRLAF